MRPGRLVVALSGAAALALSAGAGAQTPATRHLHGAPGRRAPAHHPPARGQLRLVLPLVGDQAGLNRLAQAISTPGSGQYGRFRTVSWIARRFGASPSVRRRVLAYLRAHGATDVAADATGLQVDARMDAAAAGRLFGRPLAQARPRTGARRRHAALAARSVAPPGPVTLPRALRGLVTGVVGLDTAPVATESLPPSSGYPGPPAPASPSGCPAGVGEGGFTPNEYLGAYGYTPLQQQGLLGQGERVALIEIDGFRARDLAAFAACFHLGRPRIRSFGIGAARAPAPGGEATLDLEVLDAAAPGLRTVDVYETEPDAADVLRAISQPLQNASSEPQVISVSLGLCERDTLEGIGRAGIRAIETTLKVAAVAGISVLGASGDLGSADCAQTASNPPAPAPGLAVNFPSSSPWVTSVGGTNLTLDSENRIAGQTVWNDGAAIPGAAGGGGNSELFSRPSWQDGVVAGPWRAQPDVAMLSDVSPGYAVFCTASKDCHGRGWLSFGGTSAATPLLAGGFALIDELLRREDRTALGLANPLLYRLGRDSATAAGVFYDVTAGSDDVGPFIRASQQPLGCCAAQPGYDEASGWGGVDLQGLAQAAVSAQRELAQVTIVLPRGQHPYRSGAIRASVGCSAACEVRASATVEMAGGAAFTIRSPVARLVHRNRHQLALPLDARQRRLVGTALAQHRRVAATLTAQIVDSGGNVERRSAPAVLPIRS